MLVHPGGRSLAVRRADRWQGPLSSCWHALELRNTLHRGSVHVAHPGVEHVANIDLASRVLAPATAVFSRHVALITATDLQPLRAFAGNAESDPVINFQIVGQH